IEDEEDFGSRTYCRSCGQPFHIPEQSELEPMREAPIPEPPVPAGWTLRESDRLKWRYPSEIPQDGPAPSPLLNSVVVDADGRLFACLQNEVVALALENDEP